MRQYPLAIMPLEYDLIRDRHFADVLFLPNNHGTLLIVVTDPGDATGVDPIEAAIDLVSLTALC